MAAWIPNGYKRQDLDADEWQPSVHGDIVCNYPVRLRKAACSAEQRTVSDAGNRTAEYQKLLRLDLEHVY